MGHTGCSQERWGEGEQPGQTYLLVHVWVKGTVLSKKHKVPCKILLLYPSWKIRISPLGKGEQTAWSLGHRIHGSREKSQMLSPGGEGVKLHGMKSPLPMGGDRLTRLSPLPDTAPAQLKPRENRGCPQPPPPHPNKYWVTAAVHCWGRVRGEKFTLRGAKGSLEGGLNNSPHVDLSVSLPFNKTLGKSCS